MWDVFRKFPILLGPQAQAPFTSSVALYFHKNMFNILFKALKTFGHTGGNLVNYIHGSSQRCLPPVTDEILILPTHELAARIRRRELTSEEVVRAFINRARIVQLYLNAIIDERYDDALKDAKAIDEFLKTTTLSLEELEQQKPFLGLPFTAKDSIQVAGMKWSSGCYRRKDLIADEDAPVVKNYRKAGAIPIALTNVPELLLWFASSNKLYGTTNNPFDLSRTPGGSSGGEAALVSACGSPLSICSDIGGSIRMPAFHCGLFGHKPTHEVIDYHGTFPEINDGLEKMFSFGPITRYVDDILPALKVMAGDKINLLHDIDKPVELDKIRVFYIDDVENDMSTRVEPYISESIRQAAFHLGRKYGCPVERAHFKNFKHISLWFTLLFSNNQEVSSLITENTYKINPFMELCKSLIGQSDYSPSALTVAAAQATTQATCSPDQRPELYRKTRETLAAAQKEFKALLGDDGVLLYVTLPRTAPTHYASVFEFTNVCCPMVMNYLGAPVTQVPTGLNEGLPYGIQVAAAPHNDRLTIAVSKQLEELFGGWIKPCDILLDKDKNPFRAHTRNHSFPVATNHIITNSTTSSSPTALEQVGV
jgi:fatty acid amide hydrolase 2